MNRTTLAIAGMHCQHCVSKVTQALNAVDGVQHVAVLLAEGEAEVDAAPGVQPDDLAAVVTAAGYPAAPKSV